MTWILKDDNGTEREIDTRAEAESEKAKLEGIGATVDISKIEETSDASKVELDGTDVVEMSGGDGGNSTDTDDDDSEEVDGEGVFDVLSFEELSELLAEATDSTPEEIEEGFEIAPPEEGEVVGSDTKQALDKLGDSIEEDPLSVLPGYMITLVDGKPSLNKRGVSVLAYHYDIDVIERDVVAYPHDHEFETAVVEIMVEGGDGRTFSGVGEAHVDETPKHQLLRMAETRAYKRAVIFATGTGIVSYQELTGQLEDSHE